MLEGFQIDRSLPARVYPLAAVFRGIGRSPGVKLAIAPAETRRRLLRSARVEVCAADVVYMRVSADDGRIMVGIDYLRTGPERELYLDLVHELTHVRQFH